MDIETKLQVMRNYSPYQFSFFRIILGIYLVFHFASLLPYCSEIWSNIGLMSDASLNMTYGHFPNVLNFFDSPIVVQIFICVLLICSLLFLFGIQRQIVSFILWYGWVCLFDRNNLISNPGLPYIAWILLCCVVIPKGEPFVLFSQSKEDWNFPKVIFIGAWIIMAVGYTISGLDKFFSPSWRDGSAIFHLLNNPLSRDWGLRTFILGFPKGFISLMTWGILFIEIAFLPFAIWNKSRKWIWLAMIFMHLGILFIVDFADLTIGMLMIHWFTFDSDWLKPKLNSKGQNIVFFDGVCGLCNNFIDLLLKEDRHDVLHFSALQGETVKQYLNHVDTTNLKTVVYYSDNHLYTQSDAIIKIYQSIGGVWKLTIILKLIPKSLRDLVYNYISKNRIKWFGQKETCRMPTEKERGKLLP